MLLSKLVPAIEAKWPRDQRVIRAQQDNAPAHIEEGLMWQNGTLSVFVENQPARSPALNLLDLDFLQLFSHFSSQKWLGQLTSSLAMSMKHFMNSV